MKVCTVVINSVWYDPRVRKQISEYKNCGIDVCCVGSKCNRYDEEKIKNIPCETNITSINPKFDGKQSNVLRKSIREILKQRAVTKAIIDYKPDLIHANDLNALIPAYKAAKKLHSKIIYDSHEIFVENFSGKFFAPYVWYLKAQEKFLCRRVDKMISVSNAAADYFKKLYNIERPTVVTNCCLARDIAQNTDKNEGFEILNHGQFYAGRGYDIMLEAAPLLKESPEIKLAIRGFGEMEEELRARKEELSASNFIFYPPVTVDKLIESASHSMVGVAITEAICLNFKLSVSNKIFEYAAAGLPVIMSDIPEHRYLNEKYEFGIILEDNSPEAFAKAALKLYSDKDFYNKCAQNARRLSNELNWENEFKKIISMCK